MTGEIYIARVIHGGLADRSGEGSLTVLFFSESLSSSCASDVPYSHIVYTRYLYYMSHRVSIFVYVLPVEGLLHAGDRLVEVNGQPVFGLEPEQIIQILVSTHFHSYEYMLYVLSPLAV